MALVGVVFALFSFKKVPPEVSPLPSLTKAITFPHHDLLLDRFSSFYGYFSEADRHRVKRILLFSPNHFQSEAPSVATRTEDLVLNQRVMHIDRESIFTLIRQAGVMEDNDLFGNEHGVVLHAPYIAEYFSDAQVIPLLFTRSVSREKLAVLESALRPIFADEGTIIIASIDFSHYLTAAEAQEKDEITLDLVQKGAADTIMSLSDDHLDCPSCLSMLLRLMESSKNSQPEVLFHENSKDFMPMESDKPTTSYFIFRWLGE